MRYLAVTGKLSLSAVKGTVDHGNGSGGDSQKRRKSTQSLMRSIHISSPRQQVSLSSTLEEVSQFGDRTLVLIGYNSKTDLLPLNMHTHQAWKESMTNNFLTLVYGGGTGPGAPPATSLRVSTLQCPSLILSVTEAVSGGVTLAFQQTRKTGSSGAVRNERSPALIPLHGSFWHEGLDTCTSKSFQYWGP